MKINKILIFIIKNSNLKTGNGKFLPNQILLLNTQNLTISLTILISVQYRALYYAKPIR